MIEITDAAAAELKELLEKEKKTDHGLRVFAAGSGCSGIQYGLTLEKTAKDEDAISESNGIKIFFNKDIQEDIEDFKIDFIDNEYGKGFVIDNPNAPKCGSGCSSCG
ncbi:MAG TPA: iron-sulfur cluster assembly accessory protein [Candidatus Methanoperedens sp.]|jgi:iron-sulfur cluster insertion protein|uniref:HesB/IscA family protein n=1 Tax=Candidatus Methanoperedens sp. BLZ2 TaxID=2035255 RepID=UPI000BE37609|nr:iron-sulfur cluster assembly accessory protein [Candidatus Methanoperedens sp. BLZ2]KAB2942733.1 MAG: iron-sulfur cluster assembly accessory protein [Candidatus Methanoperedens sp.]MBZ0175375.1 iron-sulfur cluster assembly accessory protein [Candidatus Methanoperedens nitroreducens]VVB53742.1 Iron-sulfur cluster insertion protein ErpA [uncultured archaeon]MCX9079516.1 iron-sulfur cluster assembly accessory protein [Candidatus Methanoperedens sp.]MCX9086372.1 iron-sulfur cluster assembly acc